MVRSPQLAPSQDCGSPCGEFSSKTRKKSWLLLLGCSLWTRPHWRCTEGRSALAYVSAFVVGRQRRSSGTAPGGAGTTPAAGLPGGVGPSRRGRRPPWALGWWWSEPGASPGVKLCRVGSQPGTGQRQPKGLPAGGAPVLGSGARDTLWVVASVPSAAGRVLMVAFQRERGFLTPVTFTSWAAALEPGACVRLFFHCVLAVVSSSPPRSMSVACLL